MHLSPTIGHELAEDATLRCLSFAIQRVDANIRHERREARRHSGACYSGMDAGPVEPATCRDYIAAAEASAERRGEIGESPAWKAKVAADALCKSARRVAQQAEALRSACSRVDGSGVANLNALAVLADELRLACSDAYLTVYDAEHQGEVA